MPTYSLHTRNLRDGQLVINDGSSTPQVCTILNDTGDFSWTETENAIQILDRGVLDTVRDGDQAPVELSFSIKWAQLIQDTVVGSDPIVLYEMVNNIEDTYVSVGSGGCGQKYMLKYVFTVTDPCDIANEVITFNKVFKKTLKCGEGNEFNKIDFSGIDFEVLPTITHTA